MTDILIQADIATVPSEMANLQSLTSLTIRDARLEADSYPTEFGLLKGLNRLNNQGNEYVRFPHPALSCPAFIVAALLPTPGDPVPILL